MLNDLVSRAKSDFARARFKAFLNQVRGTLGGQPRRTLLSYDEIKEKPHIVGPIYRGVRTVEVGKAVE